MKYLLKLNGNYPYTFLVGDSLGCVHLDNYEGLIQATSQTCPSGNGFSVNITPDKNTEVRCSVNSKSLVLPHKQVITVRDSLGTYLFPDNSVNLPAGEQHVRRIRFVFVTNHVEPTYLEEIHKLDDDRQSQYFPERRK